MVLCDPVAARKLRRSCSTSDTLNRRNAPIKVTPPSTSTVTVSNHATLAECDGSVVTTCRRTTLVRTIAAVEHNRRRALIGPDATLIDAVSRLPAGLYQRVLATGARRRSH